MKKGIIVGAGIGGLSTAIALQKVGVSVSLCEAAKEIKPVGAGILVPPNALAVLSEYDLADELQVLGHTITQTMITTRLGKNIVSTPSKYGIRGQTYSTIAIHRGKLQEVLLSALKNVEIVTHSRVSEWTNSSDRVAISFDGKDSEYADFLVGADGLYSNIRSSIFPNSMLRKSGQICCRGVANVQLDTSWVDQLTEMWGEGDRFGFVQIAANRVYWYATFRELENIEEELNLDYLLEKYSNYHVIVSDILRNTPREALISGAIRDLYPLERWWKGSTVLVGDAAHAMTPNLGQGGAQAIEDSYELAHCIATCDSFDDAFATYEARRKTKVQKLTQASWQMGQVTNVKSPLLCWARNTAVRTFAPFAQRQQLRMLYD